MRWLLIILVSVLVSLGAGAAAAGQGDQAWLGVAVEPGLRGARVTEVIPGTPAEYLGLRAGDEIRSVAGRAVATPEQLIGEVGRHAVGATIELALRRGGSDVVVRATLSARFEEDELLAARLVDKAAPSFELPVAAGSGAGALDELAGKVVVLEFLGTWCGPCKSTYRALDQLDGERDVVVLGISSDAPAALAAHARAERIGFALLHDPGDAIKRAYFAGPTPTLVVIDRRGVVRHASVGAGASLDHAIFAARRAAAERTR